MYAHKATVTTKQREITDEQFEQIPPNIPARTTKLNLALGVSAEVEVVKVAD